MIRLSRPVGRPLVSLSGLAVLAVVAALVVGCGGPASLQQPYSFEADSEAVIARAVANNYKFCKVLDDEVCQSPDSNLYFHLPRRLLIDSPERSFASQLKVSNRGHEPITITEYFITIVDDQNVSYQAGFSGPGGFDNSRPFSPALELSPGEDAEIVFSETLERESTAVRAVAISYKLLGDYIFNKVVVSYRPTSLRGVNAAQDPISGRPN